MTVLRLAQHHPGHKRAKGKRQPDKVRNVSDPQPQGHDRQDEKLTVVPARDALEERRDQPGASVNHREQEYGRPKDRARQNSHAEIGALELGENDDHRNDGQILDDQHADHDSARERSERAVRPECL